MAYSAQRTRNLYTPGAAQPFKLSRSKIELYMSCPRCFYLDRRSGIGRPPGFPFNLNSAVDALLKKEFDFYREQKKPHPYMVENNIFQPQPPLYLVLRTCYLKAISSHRKITSQQCQLVI